MVSFSLNVFIANMCRDEVNFYFVFANREFKLVLDWSVQWLHETYVVPWQLNAFVRNFMFILPDAFST